MITRASAALLSLAMVMTLGGCSTIQRSSGDREMTAYFAKTRSFFPGSRVMVMGIDVGRVDKIESEGDRIRIDFHIRRDVPIARGANASIVPLNLVGERNLVLHPAWRPGMAKESGNVIPANRTNVPVETDDALKAFSDVAGALDPTKVKNLTGRTAKSFKGNGDEFNAALEQGARLTANFAAQDKELVEVGQNLSRLAGVVRGREDVVGSMIKNFGETGRVLAAERQDLQQLVKGTLTLAKEGGALAKKYEGQLPRDLAVLAQVALVLKGNTKQLGTLLEALPGLGGALINAYNPELKTINTRLAAGASLRTFLKGLTGSNNIPCGPEPFWNCPWQNGGQWP